jgi:dynein heavy chain
MITPRTNLNLVQQLATMIDAQLPEPDQNPPEEFDQLEKFFIFCLMWSLGGCLLEEEREVYSEFVRSLSGLILSDKSLYDEFFDIKKNTMSKWSVMVPEYVAPANKKFAAILVPTVDTVRYSWLLE